MVRALLPETPRPLQFQYELPFFNFLQYFRFFQFFPGALTSDLKGLALGAALGFAVGDAMGAPLQEQDRCPLDAVEVDKAFIRWLPRGPYSGQFIGIHMTSSKFWAMTRPDGANICLFQRFFNILVPRGSNFLPEEQH